MTFRAAAQKAPHPPKPQPSRGFPWVFLVVAVRAVTKNPAMRNSTPRVPPCSTVPWLRQWWRAVFIASLMTVLTVLLGVSLRLRGIGEASGVATLVALLPLAGAGVAWARKPTGRLSPSTGDQIREAAQRLGRMVLVQWRKESSARQLRDPMPLAVHWTPSRPEVADQRDAVRGRVSGQTDRIDRIVADFRRLPKRRLAVLGPPGSGKTTLVLLIALRLLEDPRPGEPVPLVLSLSSWNPDRDDLQRWVERRIAQDYPDLRDIVVYGATAIQDLVHGHLVLPILDGLDELPRTRRIAAVAAINRAMSEGLSVVVTCRTAEYQSAVAAGEVLKGTAVIEPGPVHPRDAIDFLRSGKRGTRSQRWQPVFDQIRQRDTPLAAALATPLMVSLARLVYASENTNPGELADARRFPDRESVQDHLLDTLIPALVTPTDHAHRALDPDQARKWLSFLACHMNRLGTYDLAWWHLQRAVPVLARPRLRAVLVGVLVTLIGGITYGITTGLNDGPAYGAVHGPIHGLAFGAAAVIASICLQSDRALRASSTIRGRGQIILSSLAIGLACGFAYGVIDGLLEGFTYGFSVGIDSGVGYGFAVGLAMGLAIDTGMLAPPCDPMRADFGLRGRGMVLLRILAISLANGCVLGGIAGLVETLFVKPGFRNSLGFAAGPYTGLTFGIVFGIVFGVIRWTRTSVTSDKAADPRLLLRIDRSFVVFRACLFASAITLVLLAVGANKAGLAYTIRHFGVVEAGIMAGSLGLLSGAWTYYRMTSMWLASRRRLPWRLMAFLEDCHELGILRQVGTIYQFRHANLQDHLVSAAISYSPRFPRAHRPITHPPTPSGPESAPSVPDKFKNESPTLGHMRGRPSPTGPYAQMPQSASRLSRARGVWRGACRRQDAVSP